VNIVGTAFVDLATDVEAVEFRGGNETKMLSDWRLSVTDLRLDADGFAFTLTEDGLKGWKAPEDRPYLGKVWIIVADDEGRSRAPSSLGYGGSGSVGLQAGWSLPGRPTRLSLVRPTAVERVEVPVQLRGIVVPD
jgi:hypothetical protein